MQPEFIAVNLKPDGTAEFWGRMSGPTATLALERHLATQGGMWQGALSRGETLRFFVCPAAESGATLGNVMQGCLLTVSLVERPAFEISPIKF